MKMVLNTWLGLSAITCPYKREAEGHLTQMDAEAGGMQPPAQEHLEPPPPGSGSRGLSALGSPGEGCWVPEPQEGRPGLCDPEPPHW